MHRPCREQPVRVSDGSPTGEGKPRLMAREFPSHPGNSFRRDVQGFRNIFRRILFQDPLPKSLEPIDGLYGFLVEELFLEDHMGERKRHFPFRAGARWEPLVGVGRGQREPAFYLDKLPPLTRSSLPEVAEAKVVPDGGGVGPKDIGAKRKDVVRVLQIMDLELLASEDPPIGLPKHRSPERLFPVAALRAKRPEKLAHQTLTPYRGMTDNGSESRSSAGCAQRLQFPLQQRETLSGTLSRHTR